MPKTLFLFAGQGSQYTGMGKELLARVPQAAELYTIGSAVLGFDLQKLCFEADAELLALTEHAQPAIFVTSLLAYQAAQQLGIDFDGVAGHSLGEYAAMVASGMLSVEQGFSLIKARAHFMGECAKRQDSGMYAVMSGDLEEIAAVCAGIDGYVVPVNYNSAVQTVIAGEQAAAQQAAAVFAAKKIKCIKLAVNAAFHSKLMQPAAEPFYEAIKEVPFSTPTKDFFSNVVGDKLTSFSDMPSYLARHLVSPVLFTKELAAAQADGYTTFVELGPNRVLSGLVKKTLKEVTVFNIEDEKTYQKYQAK